MANEKVLKGPYWTRNWIEAMWRFTNENFVDFDTGAVDYEALGKEEFQFRKALFFRNFKNSERAKMAFASAADDYKNPVENGKKGGRPKKSPQDATNGNAVDDRKVATSCDTLKVDGDIREDSQAKQHGSAITRNETRHIDALEPSANHYATRQAKNGDAATSDGADESTTVSRNMRRVPQNGAPAHGFSGGRTAQGTMSRSPEAAAQSGKASALDSLPDKDGQSAKTRDNRASVRYAPPSCSPEDGNHYDQDHSISTDNTQPEGLTGPSHGGSVASLEARESQARQSQRTGAAPERVKNQPSSHCGKAPVRSFGEYGLVHMTDSQANNLRSYYGEDFDRAVGILENYILSLPSKAEGDEKGEAKLWREDYAKRNHYFAMRRDNWVDNALKKSKTADKRLENASNPNYKSFKQQDLDDRTEFFSKSIFDGKEAI